MQITRRKLLDMNRVLMNADKVFKRPIIGRFYYAVTKNRSTAEEERKLTVEAYPYDEKFLEFERKRDEMLIEAVSTRPENMSVNQALAMLPVDQKDALQARVNTLAEEYKEAIDEENARSEEREKFLDEMIEVDIRTVTPNEIPEIVAEDGWSVYAAIDPMIKE